MIPMNHIAAAVYGCIIGNWLEHLYRTFTHGHGGDRRFAVLAQITTGEYIRVIETDSQEVAYDFEGQVDDDTDTITGLVFDRHLPGDAEELKEIEVLDTVPIDAEERDKLLVIIHDARKYI